MKKIIEDLVCEKNTLLNRVEKIDGAIKALRDVCTHTDEKGKSLMEYEGNDSHKEYHKCSLCGEKDWV